MPKMSSASSMASLCISDQNILLVAPSAIIDGSFLPMRLVLSVRRPLTRRIWIFV
jgi:hypothetical protein